MKREELLPGETRDREIAPMPMTELEEAQAEVDALARALNDAIAGIVSTGLLDATVGISYGGGDPNSVYVKVRERTKFELELIERRT